MYVHVCVYMYIGPLFYAFEFIHVFEWGNEVCKINVWVKGIPNIPTWKNILQISFIVLCCLHLYWSGST